MKKNPYPEFKSVIADLQGHLGICAQCGDKVLCSEGQVLLMQVIILRHAFWEYLKPRLTAGLVGLGLAGAAAAHFFL